MRHFFTVSFNQISLPEAFDRDSQTFCARNVIHDQVGNAVHLPFGYPRLSPAYLQLKIPDRDTILNYVELQVVQITDRQVNLISVANKSKVFEWKTPEGRLITQCACNDVQVALALQNELVYLEIEKGR